MKPTNRNIFFFVLAAALLLRVWGAFDYPGMVGDEEPFLALSKNLKAYGVGDWKYAPMTDIILAGTMMLFGDNPVGWRISGIISGTAAVLLVYLIARRLYSDPDSSVPLLASALLAFDPFHIHYCRTITQEIPVTFFFLCYLYLIVEYTTNNRQTLTAAGFALGLTVATKIYFAFAIPVVVAYAFIRTRQFRQNEPILPVCLEFALKLLLLPLSVYLLCHIFWFGRGHTLLELIQLKSDAYWIFSHNFTFQNAQILMQGGKPWEWFIKPLAFGHQLSSEGSYGRFALQINNPLFRMLVIPSLFITGYHALTSRRLQEALAPMLFAACYSLILLAARPMNSYSALVLLPFAYLMVGQAVAVISSRHQCEAEAAILAICLIIISGCYLFPVSVGFRVPVALYSPILSLANITGVF